MRPEIRMLVARPLIGWRLVSAILRDIQRH